jgi:hypothetical protein
VSGPVALTALVCPLGLRKSVGDIDRKLCECMQIASSFHTIAPTRTVRRTTESVTMATMKFPARRLIIAGGFAVAVAAAPAIAFVAMPAPAASPLACSGGEEPDLYTSVCVPHLVPNAGSPYSVIAGNPDLAAVNIPGGGGSIPCTGHNSGQCIGLAEEQQAPVVQPESSVGSSPTVTGFDDNAG